MINNTFQDTNVTFSKTQILSHASDCSNGIEFPPPTLFFLIFLYSFYSKTTATIVDIPKIAVVIISTTTTIPGKEKYDSKPYL
jgi:hypothetical protein